MAERKRIFIVGTRVLSYPRNRTLARACEVLGDIMIIELTPSFVAQWKFFWSTLSSARKEDRLLIVYPAERLICTVLLARCFFHGEIIGDTFISAYDSLVSDRVLASSWSIKALYYTIIDQLVCFCSDVLLFDTKEHEEYFRKRYLIHRSTKTLIIPITMDTEEFDAVSSVYPVEIQQRSGRFMVLFFGNYIPLQGVQYILHAIALLPDRGRFRFLMVGNGQTRGMAFRLRDELGLSDVEFIERLPHKAVIALTKKVDLTLGIFGDTEKAARVIPNKLLEAMACGTPVVTGKNSAMERYFEDGKEVYYCAMGDAQSLADAILRAYGERENRDAMRAAAREVINREFSVPVLKERLLGIVGENK
ncbi:MAG: hypothetical protein A2942_00290 [Candidatus Lloydbacteria bacterium RIFCSPLOWO2_01_FULL_50_20]|uniref:Glycosyl transferase family 1 domain-containing protein n=1 Tax=Candidatus Lloydbacteria bacterium RIFCSPLOWO2_01_FULL_50_20 TaxID=1798665 RepID=A0A1G2DFV2_9BACT|nr:MAG: hypothetical protein A3C13_04245 [Candidatus Lloydbacteria bacterium RIFCSPHIGHO2_02_FULL_50_11]OGZ12537.1 MAG: hypothetical protein A2942_00290 [Candidatus Lloydbacteria bacterium RIFCSPLOWO2_01_FULL_50_20]